MCPGLGAWPYPKCAHPSLVYAVSDEAVDRFSQVTLVNRIRGRSKYLLANIADDITDVILLGYLPPLRFRDSRRSWQEFFLNFRVARYRSWACVAVAPRSSRHLCYRSPRPSVCHDVGTESIEIIRVLLLVTFNIYLLSQDIVCIEIYNGINKRQVALQRNRVQTRNVHSFSVVDNKSAPDGKIFNLGPRVGFLLRNGPCEKWRDQKR